MHVNFVREKQHTLEAKRRFLFDSRLGWKTLIATLRIMA